MRTTAQGCCKIPQRFQRFHGFAIEFPHIACHTLQTCSSGIPLAQSSAAREYVTQSFASLCRPGARSRTQEFVGLPLLQIRRGRNINNDVHALSVAKTLAVCFASGYHPRQDKNPQLQQNCAVAILRHARLCSFFRAGRNRPFRWYCCRRDGRCHAGRQGHGHAPVYPGHDGNHDKRGREFRISLSPARSLQCRSGGEGFSYLRSQ